MRSITIKAALTAFISIILSYAVSSYAQTERTLVLAVHPYLSASDIYIRFKPFAEYLQEKTGMKFTIDISRNYEEHIKRTGKDAVDMAFMGPASYVKMVSVYGEKEILGSFEDKHKKTFKGVIFTRTDSPIESIEGLAGRSFAFGDPESTMSHLVPRYMMLQAGVKVDMLSKFDFLQNHDNVALSVLIGDYDSGAIKDESFEKYKSKGLKAIAWTPEMPDHLFVATSKMSKEELEAVRNILLGMHMDEEGLAVLHAIKKDLTALASAKNSDYDNLNKIILKLQSAGEIK